MIEKITDKILGGNDKMKFKENEYGQRTFENKGIKYVEFKEEYFVSEDILSKEIIDDIVEDKRCLDSEKDVRYNNDIFDNSWKNSFIRKILNNNFKEKYLNNLDLDGEVRCLTKEEVESLPSNLRETSRYGYWTMSPSSAINARVFAVASDGSLGLWSVNNSFGVRPVIFIDEKDI